MSLVRSLELASPRRLAQSARPGYMLRIARLDLTLLWRNRTALFSVIGVPLFFGAMLLVSRGNGNKTAGLDAVLYTGTGDLAFFVIFAVFVNLVNVFTARREDLTLKRLRGGALSDVEILGGSVVSATALYLIQAGVVIVIIATALGAGAPANVLLLVLGMLLGAVVFALLAFALSGLTPTTELAQMTVLPIMIICIAGSGFMFPVDELPDGLRPFAQGLPLTPVVEIVRTAYLGQDFTAGGGREQLGFVDSWAACGPALLILAGWVVVGTYAARRWFRWEPRNA
ncbi:ABC transporter permease [Actinomadura sp. HBU206391]|uniref:ABC transporter permease n=1 Tax=Actinomadura sp. HBU206391 TaxID=2731692 RepID=UPI00164F2ED7|nr:ABC transporter permease [Actinomadura sp. HBU206391]MBC6457100.1 ABC transporter permease [Actinomadura sp. HBU206391]